LQLVLSWPVRILVVALLAFSIFVDGAGYWYRIINHSPLTGYVADMPPHFGDWQLYIHKGLDIQGGTHMELRLKDLPPGRTGLMRGGATMENLIGADIDAPTRADITVAGVGPEPPFSLSFLPAPPLRKSEPC